MKTIRWIVCLSLFPLLLQAQSLPTRENPALVGVDLNLDTAIVERLQLLDLDLATVDRKTGEAQIIADQRDLELLALNKIPFRIKHRDLKGFYKSGLDQGVSKTLGLGSMGGYYTLSEVEDKLDELRQKYPNLITQKMSLGKSHENRDIWAVKISDNPDTDENEPESLIDSLTHAREPAGMMVTIAFMEWVLASYPADPIAKFLIENREMWFVPVHNPDGYRYNQQTDPNGGGMWRKNRRKNSLWSRGVDLNRNWGYKWGYNNKGSSPDPNSQTYRGPSAMSEPEVQALANFMLARGVVERLSIHCHGGYWLFPWCYEKILTPEDEIFRSVGLEMAPPTYEVGTCWEILYMVNGGSLDWDYGQMGIITFSPEMGYGFWPVTSSIPNIINTNLPSLKYFFQVAGSYLTLQEGNLIEDITGDLNGYPDPSETVNLVLTLKNLGLVGNSGPVTLDISTTYPHVNVITGSVQAPAIPKREVGDNSAQPLVLEILPSAQYADVIDIKVMVGFDGATLEYATQVIVGTPRRMILDEAEIPQGWWTFGVFDDNATQGLWEQGDPFGTWDGPEQVQPEDDHTPAGTDCFVTGMGVAGAGPDDYDLDGGKTTLVSPMFDLSTGLYPRIGYSRWYYRSSGKGVFDQMRISLSNDGGVTWTQLEKIQGNYSNHWKEMQWFVEDFMAPTDQMMVKFVAQDGGDDSTVEALMDDFWAETYSTHPTLSLYGGLSIGKVSHMGMSWESGGQINLFAGLSVHSGVVLPGGTWYLNTPLYDLGISSIPLNGNVNKLLPIPNMPGLIGVPLHFQAIAGHGGNEILISNLITKTVN